MKDELKVLLNKNIHESMGLLILYANNDEPEEFLKVLNNIGITTLNEFQSYKQELKEVDEKLKQFALESAESVVNNNFDKLFKGH